MINNGFLFHCRTQNQLVDPRDWTVQQGSGEGSGLVSVRVFLGSKKPLQCTLW